MFAVAEVSGVIDDVHFGLSLMRTHHVENIEHALATVDPHGVDACSALEERPGKKSHERLRTFVKTIRSVKP